MEKDRERIWGVPDSDYYQLIVAGLIKEHLNVMTVVEIAETLKDLVTKFLVNGIHQEDLERELIQAWTTANSLFELLPLETPNLENRIRTSNLAGKTIAFYDSKSDQMPWIYEVAEMVSKKNSQPLSFWTLELQNVGTIDTAHFIRRVIQKFFESNVGQDIRYGEVLISSIVAQFTSYARWRNSSNSGEQYLFCNHDGITTYPREGLLKAIYENITPYLITEYSIKDFLTIFLDDFSNLDLAHEQFREFMEMIRKRENAAPTISNLPECRNIIDRVTALFPDPQSKIRLTRANIFSIKLIFERAIRSIEEKTNTTGIPEKTLTSPSEELAPLPCSDPPYLIQYASGRWPSF
ncbi:MAG: hypothetical protein UX04_C0003G0010 [Microgenomates group bacterium GW2011_GWF2_45_18]|nr:MAG: hypothetical protein UW18_C0002G0010 [Microgenomates group bacterium GW2011_GWF1_44_10]KKU01738.1 MAG: hypothetical protein UX04_C0003G0010 [Microgenomates group bacterium GW2011_GWF2_45_18]OGJ41285.1 MAG: hypothetical protein A2378_02700 [Candidatus Pacebacteria bacterium RIFOXYB1_FULL_44_10]HAU98962.1 hypothetical protein [Candidatus Paceibacterota bacterium]HAX01082.1 hypothetical protein [Candidatus Paceibacterota bacterium]